MPSTNGPAQINRLDDIDLFAACTPRELRRIEALTTTGHIAAGRVVFRRGDVGRECFVILDGQADIDVDGRHHIAGRGTLIGEIALLVQGAHRTATVVAVTDLTVLVFTRTEFSQLMNGLPAVAHKVMREATKRLLEDFDPQTKDATRARATRARCPNQSAAHRCTA